MSEENQGGFKITDRRLFNPDGTMREDAVIEEESVSPEPVIDISQPSIPAGAPAEPPPMEEPGGMPEQTLFNEFLMGIASSAFIYLGLVEHPATGRRQVDLGAAKESIDMLDMLREKTKGNLTRGEDKFFEELLADLKMQFVARRR